MSIEREAPGETHNTTEITVVDGRMRETGPPPMGQTARLVCILGHEPDIGRTFSLDGTQRVVIGRDREAQISIAETEVSRAHAAIVPQRGKFMLSDLGSRNGTTVNGVPVVDHVLQPGDRIQLGAGPILMFTVHDELESRALRFQRLESLAALTGGIVHDFRNTLGAVVANAELLEGELAGMPPNQAAAEMVADILSAARASLETAKRLLYFSDRKGGADREDLEVETVIQVVVAMVRRTFSTARIRVEVQAAPSLHVRGDRDELEHAVLNLVMNAREAMPEGGTIAISTDVRTLGRAEALALQLPREGDYVEISVSDTGTGMDAATQARIFEPFFTTKPPGSGTGLGLSTVYGIIRRQGGNVLVDSAPERGTRIRILVPGRRT